MNTTVLTLMWAQNSNLDIQISPGLTQTVNRVASTTAHDL